MIDPANPNAQVTYEIDPLMSPLFQILQPVAGTTTWAEVGFVWTVGSSRVNATEHWYLYKRVNPNGSQAAYTWPGYTTAGQVSGTELRLVPAVPPEGQTPGSMQSYLERSTGAAITYVMGTMASG